jgi:hypothetical protein
MGPWGAKQTGGDVFPCWSMPVVHGALQLHLSSKDTTTAHAMPSNHHLSDTLLQVSRLASSLPHTLVHMGLRTDAHPCLLAAGFVGCTATGDGGATGIGVHAAHLWFGVRVVPSAAAGAGT